MFKKLFEIEKEIEEYEAFVKCGIYRIYKNNQYIFTIDKLESLKRDYKSEENKIKRLYF